MASTSSSSSDGEMRAFRPSVLHLASLTPRCGAKILEEKTFIWNIESFRTVVTRKGTLTEGFECRGSRWNIFLHSHGNDVNALSVLFGPVCTVKGPNASSRVCVESSLALAHAEDDTIFTHVALRQTFIPGVTNWGSPRRVNTFDLSKVRDAFSRPILEGDRLRFVLYMRVIDTLGQDLTKTTTTDDCHVYIQPPVISPRSYARYLFDVKASDATIAVKRPGTESVKIPVSKLPLMACSPVFDAMFRSEFLEGQTAGVIVEDAEETPVRAMIEFAYTNDISTNSLSLEYYKQLYNLAERYEITDLPAIAAAGVVSNYLTMETVFELLDFAERYSNQVLYNALFEFLRDHHTMYSEKGWIFAIENGGVGVAKAISRLLIKNALASQGFVYIKAAR
ncbi:hypothetical protein SeLEV6574_g04336 [Synchytrium endobioticum]|nr:hypothetical protein SeLEV6574_g04336 [Synchytrium endobioticum]